MDVEQIEKCLRCIGDYGLHHAVQHPIDPSTELYLVSDPGHFIKTSRNCLIQSRLTGGKRLLWNEGFLVWDEFIHLFNMNSTISHKNDSCLLQTVIRTYNISQQF